MRRTPKFSERFDFAEKMHFGCWQGSSLQCKLSLQKLHFLKKLANENFGIKFNLQKIVDFLQGCRLYRQPEQVSFYTPIINQLENIIH